MHEVRGGEGTSGVQSVKPWTTVIRNGKAETMAIGRNNQYIAKCVIPSGTVYVLTIGDERIGQYDTPEEAKAAADKERIAA